MTTGTVVTAQPEAIAKSKSRWRRFTERLFLEEFPDVLDLIEYLFIDIYIHFLQDGQRYGITWPGIDLEDPFVLSVFGMEVDAGEEGIIPEVVYDYLVELGVESLEDVSDQIMGEGSGPFYVSGEHRYGHAYARAHVDDEGLFLVPDENGAALRRLYDGLNFDLDHCRIIWMAWDMG